MLSGHRIPKSQREKLMNPEYAEKQIRMGQRALKEWEPEKKNGTKKRVAGTKAKSVAKKPQTRKKVLRKRVAGK